MGREKASRSTRSLLSSAIVLWSSARAAKSRIFLSYRFEAPGVAPCSTVKRHRTPMGILCFWWHSRPAPHRPHSWKAHLLPYPSSPWSPLVLPHFEQIFRKLRAFGSPPLVWMASSYTEGWWGVVRGCCRGVKVLELCRGGANLPEEGDGRGPLA